MVRVYFRHAISTALVSVTLAGCMASQPTKDPNLAQEEMNLDRAQMGDSSLTCSEIAAQVSKLDAMLPHPETSQDAVQKQVVGAVAADVGTQAANQAVTQAVVTNPSLYQYVPYLGSAVQAVSHKLANDQAVEQQRQMKAQMRKDYLIALYNERKCTRSVNARSDGTTYKVQGYLNALGYSCGKADGVMGPKTIAAIRAFERDHNLPVNGEVTPALLRQLEVAAAP